MTMVVQKGLGKAAPVSGAAKDGKENKPAAAPKVDIGNMSAKDAYKALVEGAKTRTASGVKSSDLIEVVDKLFRETGEDKIMFSAAATYAKAKMGGKKVYNPLRSAVLAKSSKYDLEQGADGFAYIIRKPE
jgi:hypothetical protein